MPDITPEIRSKLNMLATKIGTQEVDAWGQGFLKNVTGQEKKFLSTAQLSTVEKMFDRLFRKQIQRDKEKIIKTDRLYAYKTSGGWQLYIDHKAVGVCMGRHEADVMLTWFEHSLESLEYVLKQPRVELPAAIETKETEQNEHHDNEDPQDHADEALDEQRRQVLYDS